MAEKTPTQLASFFFVFSFIGTIMIGAIFGYFLGQGGAGSVREGMAMIVVLICAFGITAMSIKYYFKYLKISVNR